MMREYEYTVTGHTFGDRFKYPFELGFTRQFQADSEAIEYATSDDVFLDVEEHEGRPVNDAVVRVRCEEGDHGMTVAFDEMNLLVDAEVW